MLVGILLVSGLGSYQNQSRISIDRKFRGYFVRCGIHLGNNNIWVVRETLCQLVINWCQGLAMSTPRSIKFDKYILILLKYNILYCFSNENLNRGIILGDRLRFDVSNISSFCGSFYEVLTKMFLS